MPDLNTIIQRMKDAGEDDIAINDVIEAFNRRNPPKPVAPPAPPVAAAPPPDPGQRKLTPEETRQVVKDQQSIPGDWWSGFSKAYFPLGGEADQASWEALKGYGQGAIADLPETVGSVLSDFGSLFTNPGQLLQAREAFTEGVPAVARNVYEAGAASGADPHSFGRVMGQLTGQPLVMEGLRVPTGKVLETGGRLVKENTPFTGVLPPIARPHTAYLAEKAAGAGAEWLGKKIQGIPTKTPKPVVTGVGTDVGTIQGAKPPGFWTKQRSLRNPRGIGMARGEPTGIPTRDQPLPYEPNPIQQDIGGAPGEFVTPEPVEGNILAQPPRGAASRNQPIPFENQGPRPVPEPSGAPGEFDLTQPITEPIPVQPQRGLGNRPPSRLQDMPFEPTPEPLPPGEFDLTQPIEGTIPIQGMENAPMPSRLMEMPFEPTPEPPPYGYGIDLTEPIESTIPLGEQSEVIPSRLRDMPYTPGEYTEAAAAGSPRPKPAGASVPRSAAASKFEPSVKPEPTTPPKEMVETPSGDVIDPVTGEIINEASFAEPEPPPGMVRATGEISVEPPTGVAETPQSIVEAANLPPETKASILQRIAQVFGPEAEGSRAMPSWAERVAEKLVGGKNPLTPEIPEGQVSNRRMFDLSGEVGAGNALAAESERFANQIARPGASEFSPDLVPTSENILGGTSPTFKPREVPVEAPPKKPSLFKRAKEAADKFARDEEGSINFGDEEPPRRISTEPWTEKLTPEELAERRAYSDNLRSAMATQGKQLPIFTDKELASSDFYRMLTRESEGIEFPDYAMNEGLPDLDRLRTREGMPVGPGEQRKALSRFFGSEEGSAKVPEWADKIAEPISKLIDKAKLPTHIYEAAMTPLRRAASSIGKMINDDFSALPDNEWRVKFAKTKGEHLSMDLRELGDWANKQGGTAEQKAASQQMGAYFKELADKIDATPNTPEKLDTIVGVRDMLVEAKENIEPPAQIPGLSRNVGGRLRERIKAKLSDETGSVGPDTPEIIAKNKAAREAAEAKKAERGKTLKKLAVMNPSGEKIGTITITEGDVRGIKTVAKFSEHPDEKVIDVIRKTRLKKILDEHGFTEDQVSVQEFRPQVSEPLTAEGKPKLVTPEGRKEPKPEDVLTEVPTEELKPVEATPAAQAKEAKAKATKAKSEKMEAIPESFGGGGTGTLSPGKLEKGRDVNKLSKAVTVTEGKGEGPVSDFARPTVDPEEAFRGSGDIEPIRSAFDAMSKADVPDEVFQHIIPKVMRFPLGEGETWQARAELLIKARGAFKTEEGAPVPKPAPKPAEPKPEGPLLRAKEYGKERAEKPTGKGVKDKYSNVTGKTITTESGKKWGLAEETKLVNGLSYAREDRGIANGLLGQATRDADANGVTLAIKQPSGQNMGVVAAWYRQHGFVPKESTGIWIRKPQRKASTKWGGLGGAFKGDYPKFEASPSGEAALEAERKAFLKRHPYALFDEE